MSPRYLLLVGKDTRERADLLRQIHGAHELRLVASGLRLAALANAGCPCLPLPDRGCILGALFEGEGPAERVNGLSPLESSSVTSSNGDTLLSRFWGGYVAAICSSRSTRILRDPSGTFPCYHADVGGLRLFASDAEILVACGIPVHLDADEVGRELYRSFVPSPATALRGIRELLPGFALRLGDRGWSEEACWSPWDFVGESDAAPADAAKRLSNIVGHCVRSWGSMRQHLLLSVSGGLDSSIIAACLANGETRTTCLTMFTDDPGGDERGYARALCKHLRLPLVERPYRLADIRLDEPLGPHLPRPRDRTQANAYERIHLEVASEIGADAFVTGNGGDHVFGYSQSAAPIADRYLSRGMGPGLFHSVLDVCAQTGCTIFEAIGQAWQLSRRPPGYRVRPSPLFLDSRFVAGLDASILHHPWLDAPRGALPGKAAHVAAILRVQPNVEASRGYYLPVFSPLLSQPIVEACLPVPSWRWREGGRDRSLARRAFAESLPPAILERRVKGTPSRFAARLLDHFRAEIRERLLDGQLSAREVIDRDAIEQLLAGDRPVADVERVRILELVNIEAWMAHWAGVSVEGLERPPPSAGPTA